MNMVHIVNSTAFSKALLKVIKDIDKSAEQPSMLLDAIRNWFNTRNEGFYPNFWEFRSVHVILHLNYQGVFLQVQDNYKCPYPKAKIDYLNKCLALGIGEDAWTIAFLTNFPI